MKIFKQHRRTSVEDIGQLRRLQYNGGSESIVVALSDSFGSEELEAIKYEAEVRLAQIALQDELKSRMNIPELNQERGI